MIESQETDSVWTLPTCSHSAVLVEEPMLVQRCRGMAESLSRATTARPLELLTAVQSVMQASQMGVGPQFTLKPTASPTLPDTELLLRGLLSIALIYRAESVLSSSSTLALLEWCTKQTIEIMLGWTS